MFLASKWRESDLAQYTILKKLSEKDRHWGSPEVIWGSKVVPRRLRQFFGGSTEVHHAERSLIETNLLGLPYLIFLGVIDSSRFTEGSEILTHMESINTEVQ